MLLLTKNDIKKCYTLRDGMEAVKKAFQLFSAGQIEVPLRSQMGTCDGSGNFLCMPAYSAEAQAASVKILNVFNQNRARNLPSIHAETFVMNAETGQIEALLDGNFVTQLRTGAATGVAIELLANPVCRKGALFGAGAQAITQLEAMLEARNFQEVFIFDSNQKQAEAFVTAMREQLQKYDTLLKVAATSQEAVTDADVIVTATTSTKPVFDGQMVKAGALISGVGSYRPEMQEIPANLLERVAKIYFDSQTAVLSEAGDLLIPQALGLLDTRKFSGDIGAVLNGEKIGREHPDEIIFFKTVGIAAQDLLTAHAIYQKAQSQKIGLNWDSQL